MKTIVYCAMAAILLAAMAAGQQATLPFDLVDMLDGVKFKIRVPANWNGTLLLYMQASKTAAPPPEPLVAPPTIENPAPSLEATLLARGYALAASEISMEDWQLKEEVQDTFRGLIRRPVLMMKNSADGQGEVRHESAYRAAVEAWRAEEWLQQIWVSGVGHCAFTSGQILKALGAVEAWLDTGVKPSKAAFTATDGFDPAFNPPPWPD